MKKKLLIAGFMISILSFIFMPGAKSKTNLYYNGDALYYKGAVYLTTANSGAAELFKIDNNKITKLSQVVISGKSGAGLLDAMLNAEASGLFLFVTDGQYIYKYDINDPANPKLFKRSDDQNKAEFIGLGRIDNKIYSVSNQGVKIWDDNLRAFYSGSLSNSFAHNLKFSKQGGFIFNLNNNLLEIYDAYSQRLISTFNLEVSDNHERNLVNKESDGLIYLVDDRAVKQVDFAGNLIKSFKHTSKQGYDIAYTPGDDHLYFSDGIGLVKLREKDLKPLSWIYTKKFSEAGGWATGLRVVRDNYGEKIIVFNGNGITVLNQDFKKIGSIKMPSDIVIPVPVEENLAISLNSYEAFPSEEIIISGRGYVPDENLTVYLADKKIGSAKAESNGRFLKTVIIPEVRAGRMDIRVTGESGKSYSVGFKVK